MITPALFPDIDTVVISPVGPRLELQLPGRWLFRLPRKLQTPNRLIWRSRWALASERAAWEREFKVAIGSFAAVLQASDGSPAAERAYRQLRHVRELRGVRIWRLVPTVRHFFRDTDNLDFAAKSLVDAMVRVGLLHADDRSWLERERTQEAVSGDGKPWTLIQLSRPDVRTAWRT